MDKQAIFNKVATHLLAQGARSMGKYGSFEGCAYRGAGGARCAIGVLIPDELYRNELEGVEVEHLPFDVRDALGTDDSYMREFLHELQAVHDESPVAYWRQALNNVAADWTLKPV